MPVGAARVAPDDGVVPDDPAGRVVERAHDRVRDAVGEVELRADLLDLVRRHDRGVDPEELVHLGALLRDDHPAVRVRERQVPVLREHHVEVELDREALVELDALLVEGGALGRAVVRADDRRVAARGAGADVRLLEDGDVLDPVALGEVVRGREPVRAAADDHDVVAALELAARAPHAADAEDVLHAFVSSPSRGVEHRDDDVVPELLRDVDAEALALVAEDDRRDARERACGGQAVEVEVGQAPHEPLALEREPGPERRSRRTRGRPARGSARRRRRGRAG